MSRASTAPVISRMRSRQRPLAVVDVGDDREVADAVEVHGDRSRYRRDRSRARRRRPLASSSALLRAMSVARADATRSRREISPRGEHQEPEEAQPHQRQARRAQQGDVRSELKTPHEDRRPRRSATDANDEAVRLAVKRLDMAAAKGVIHKNQAARTKSRLMKKVNAAAADASGRPTRACPLQSRLSRATSTSITTLRRDPWRRAGRGRPAASRPIAR